MTQDTPETSDTPVPSSPEPGPAPDEAPVAPADVEAGKAFAILSYVLSLIGLPFFLVPLIMRNNTFALYHSKQCLMIWLFGLAGAVLASLLVVVCIGFLVYPVVGVFMLVFLILGLINAINGQAKPLPIIGGLAESWFAGIGSVSS